MSETPSPGNSNDAESGSQVEVAAAARRRAGSTKTVLSRMSGSCLATGGETVIS